MGGSVLSSRTGYSLLSTAARLVNDPSVQLINYDVLVLVLVGIRHHSSNLPHNFSDSHGRDQRATWASFQLVAVALSGDSSGVKKPA